MSAKRDKTPRRLVDPPSEKLPRRIEKPERLGDQPIAWRVSDMDKEGPWGWRGVDGETFWQYIFEKMSSYSTMTWNEILGDKNHEVRRDKLSRNAQRRLREIEKDDNDFFVSLHINGKKRLWGIRSGDICKLLWWDPDHSVFPSHKKHT